MISTIITYGLGSYSNVYLVSTYGFGGYTNVIPSVDIELICSIDTSLSFTVEIETDIINTMELSNE